MTLSNLIYFCAVCRHKSITKAAEALLVSQPSITRAMKDLEAEFGVNLFTRQGKRLDMTPEGLFFLEKAQQIVEQCQSLEEQMRDFGNKKNHITICMPSMVGSLLFSDMFQKFHKLHPDVYLEMHEYGSEECCELVEQDRMDFAVAAVELGMSERLNMIPIVQFELLFCVGKQHPLAGCKSVSMEMLRNQLVIMQERKHSLSTMDTQQSNYIKTQFQKKGIHLNVLLYTKQLYTIKKLLMQTDVGVFLFREVAQADPDIVGIPLEEKLERSIGLMWKRGKHVYSDMRRFIAFTKDYRFE